MKFYASILRPFTWVAEIMSVVVNSTANAKITILDDDHNPISDATVTVSIFRPDSGAETITSLAVPYIGNGVYQVLLPANAFPIVSYNYYAQWSITEGVNVQNPTTFFDVTLA